MARDCPDRQRGTDWRNNGYGGRGGQRAIGGGDAVDREMEVCSSRLIYLRKEPYSDLFFSNSCKSCLVAPPVMAKLLVGSKEDLAVRTRIATSNRGSDPSRPRRTWLPGSSAVGTDLGTTMAPGINLHLRGLKTVVATTVTEVAMGQQELLPGINRLLHPLPHLLAATLAMATEGIRASRRLRLLRICQVRLLQVWVLLQLLRRVWVLCTTVLLEPLHLRHLAKDHRLL